MRVPALAVGLVLFGIQPLSAGDGRPAPGCRPAFLTAERRLGTQFPFARGNHEILRTSRPIGLGFPGLLVGIEKAWGDCIAAPSGAARRRRLNDEAPHFHCYRTWLQARLDDAAPTFVSHTVRFDGARGCSVQPLYSVYDRGPFGDRDAYVRGRNALRRLRGALRTMLATYRPTHVVVAVMGWQTSQFEAMRQTHTVLCNMQRSSCDRAAFRPLLVMVTWPASWPGGLPGHLLSYFTKANDADEVGLLWVNALLHDVVGPEVEASGVPLVALGFSFGSRVLTRAIVSRPLLDPKQRCQVRTPVDLVLALQGAWDVDRLIPGDAAEGAPYARLAYTGGAKWVLTQSRGDWANLAVRFITASRHAGGPFGWARARRHPHLFERRRVSRCGTWRPGDAPCPQGRQRVMYLDATCVIDSHTDIETQPVGRMLMQAVQRYAPRRLDERIRICK